MTMLTDERPSTARLRAAVLAAVCAAALALPAFAAPPAVPATPAPVEAVLWARPFELAEPLTYLWRAERPEIRRGHLVVLAVDPDLVYPRQTAEPVLYAGDTTAMRINHGYPSGRVVALVPGGLDPADFRVWFGAPELPEQVDAAAVEAAREAADAAGITPRSAPEMVEALRRGRAALEARDGRELLAAADALVAEWTPEEREATPRE